MIIDGDVSPYYFILFFENNVRVKKCEKWK